MGKKMDVYDFAFIKASSSSAPSRDVNMTNTFHKSVFFRCEHTGIRVFLKESLSLRNLIWQVHSIFSKGPIQLLTYFVRRQLVNG